MTPELAHDYIRRRVGELGHGNEYYLRFRHFALSPFEVRIIDNGPHFFVLAEPTENIRIQSDMGIFDVAEMGANELQYEHQGAMQLTNYSPVLRHIQMIQVILKQR